MRFLIGWSVILGLVAGSALAQAPGAPEPPAPPHPAPYGAPAPAPQPQPYGAPQPYGPPQPYGAPQPYGVPQPYAPVQLTPEEQDLLLRGEISPGAHIGGSVMAYLLGFGSGQAIQGRWSDSGWIFTVGEGLSLGAILWGAGQAASCRAIDDVRYCNDDRGTGLIVTGAVGLVVFRLWGLVDAIAGPMSHNRKVRELRARTGYHPGYYSVLPYVSAPQHGEGAVGGFTFRF